jgi:hypothetical protein
VNEGAPSQTKKPGLWSRFSGKQQFWAIATTVLTFLGAALAVTNELFSDDPKILVTQQQLPTSSVTTTTAVPKKVLRESLLAVVPSDIKESCFSNTDSSLKGSLISVECISEGVVALRFALFEDNDTMYDVYNKAVKDAGVQRNSGALNCKKKPSEGTWNASEGGEDIGHYLCYVDEQERAWLHWTYDKHKVYAYAYRKDSLKSIDDWWDNNITAPD